MNASRFTFVEPNTRPADADKESYVAHSRYYLYYAMRLFFNNGGGACYIVSVGSYAKPITQSDLAAGLDLLNAEPEPTMIVVPDAMSLARQDANSLAQAVLLQCSTLKSRVAILDVFAGDAAINVYDPIGKFRTDLGTVGLDYGAAYYPWIETAIVEILRRRHRLSHARRADDAARQAGAYVNALPDPKGQAVLKKFVADSAPGQAPPAVAAPAAGAPAAAARRGPGCCGARGCGGRPGCSGPRGPGSCGARGEPARRPPRLAAIGGADARAERGAEPGASRAGQYRALLRAADGRAARRGEPVAAVGRDRRRLRPDRFHPRRVQGPGGDQHPLRRQARDRDQRPRSAGSQRPARRQGGQCDPHRPRLWRDGPGARTLNGNSQDTRYVNVRRTMIMLEQSIKNAAQAFMFEPNTATTWVSVESMIRNFLTNQWKAGALFGATPAQAFSVGVGLGVTMTSDDILDGLMNVMVKVAIVRPAEFIVLTFQQTMPAS